MNRPTAASSSSQRAIARYDTGIHEFVAPFQSAEATGASSIPRALRPPRTSVHRVDDSAPRPRASTTARCSRAPMPMRPGIEQKNRRARVAGSPGSDASSVLMITMRSTPASRIARSTERRFSASKADRSRLVAVTPSAVTTASAPANAAVSDDESASDGTTATRESAGTSTIRSGRERTMAVKPMPCARHSARMPWPRPPAAPRTATCRRLERTVPAVVAAGPAPSAGARCDGAEHGIGALSPARRGDGPRSGRDRFSGTRRTAGERRGASPARRRNPRHPRPP
jgi:hypothetical protein